MNEMAVLTMGASAIGSAMQELVYWYNLRRRLDGPGYRTLVQSRPYWLIVFLMVIGTGFTSLIWFYGGTWPAPKDAFMFGVGLPLLIKQLGSAGKPDVRYGVRSTTERSTIDRYFAGA